MNSVDRYRRLAAMEDVAIDDLIDASIAGADPTTLSRVLTSAIKFTAVRERFASRLRDEATPAV